MDFIAEKLFSLSALLVVMGCLALLTTLIEALHVRYANGPRPEEPASSVVRHATVLVGQPCDWQPRRVG